MNTRRKFLLSGSMASVALITAKPFTSLANSLAPVTGFSVNNNKVILLHTGNYNPYIEYMTVQQINSIKKSTGNLVLLHTGESVNKKAMGVQFDSVLETSNCASVSTTNYKIIYKDKIKIGIITAAAGEKDTLNKADALAVFLKKEKNCNLVICLSKLGYKNKTTVDDIKMAENSTAMDIIIGGHPSNYTQHAFTTQNRNKLEVIIHSAADSGFALGNIEIGFDDAGNKNFVALNNSLTRITANS